MYIFDLEAVGDWLESYAQNGRVEGGIFPPCRELRCFEEGPRRLPGNVGGAVINHDSSFRFLDEGNHAVLSAGTAVFCWYTGGGNWVPGVVNLYWKFQYKDIITSMELLTSETVVLGSCIGRLAILNWKKVTRAPFSFKPTPTLVEDWASYAASSSQEPLDIPSPVAMGIRNIHVVVENTVPGKMVRYRLYWVTTSGWVLSSMVEALSSSAESKLDSNPETRIRRRKGCELHHSTKPIKWINIGGEAVSAPTRTWVVPTNRIQADSTATALVWQKVEDDVTQIIPHHDQRVLSSASSVQQLRNTKPKLHWMAIACSSCAAGTKRLPMLETIPISKRSGAPTSIAIHPSHEWIVVGTSHSGMYLVNARPKVP